MYVLLRSLFSKVELSWHALTTRVKRIVAALSVRLLPCPANNFKTTVGI